MGVSIRVNACPNRGVAVSVDQRSLMVIIMTFDILKMTVVQASENTMMMQMSPLNQGV
jgi:hypothetical protein